MSLLPCLGFLWESIGGGELFLIFVVVLVLFGPRRLPELARSLGRAVAILRRASCEFQEEILRLDTDSHPQGTLPSSTPQEVPSPDPNVTREAKGDGVGGDQDALTTGDHDRDLAG